jgi:hypothetical protein
MDLELRPTASARYEKNVLTYKCTQETQPTKYGKTITETQQVQIQQIQHSNFVRNAHASRNELDIINRWNSHAEANTIDLSGDAHEACYWSNKWKYAVCKNFWLSFRAIAKD